MNHLTDEQIRKLLRGGHDPRKVYAAYKAAVEHKGQPTVILAKTVKGYGLGEAGEGRNITHQQKKLNEKELREFRARFGIPISDEEIAETPFYRPARRQRGDEVSAGAPQGAGRVRAAARTVNAEPLRDRRRSTVFGEFLKGSERFEVSTTMAFVRLLGSCSCATRTSAAASCRSFPTRRARSAWTRSSARSASIRPRASSTSRWTAESLLYYHEAKDGQILEEGITEAGSMSSFIAAGTAYATHGEHMIPFYIYYSMFGFQRIGDLVWVAGDIRAQGLPARRDRRPHHAQRRRPAASGRPQPVLASTDPDAADLRPGVRVRDRGHRAGRPAPDVREGRGHLLLPDALQRELRDAADAGGGRGGHSQRALQVPEGAGRQEAQGAHLRQRPDHPRGAARAGNPGRRGTASSADVWSATSYKLLRSDALNVRRWNMLHPTEPPRKSYVETVLEKEEGVVRRRLGLHEDRARPDRAVGAGRTDDAGHGRFWPQRHAARLRRFFEVDAESIVVATLYALAEEGKIKSETVARAIRDLQVDPEKAFPLTGVTSEVRSEGETSWTYGFRGSVKARIQEWLPASSSRRATR